MILINSFPKLGLFDLTIPVHNQWVTYAYKTYKSETFSFKGTEKVIVIETPNQKEKSHENKNISNIKIENTKREQKLGYLFLKYQYKIYLLVKYFPFVVSYKEKNDV